MAIVTKVNGVDILASMEINGREFQVYNVAGAGSLAQATAAVRTLQQFYTVEAIGSLADPSDFNIIMSGGDDGRDLTDPTGDFGDFLGTITVTLTTF